MIGTCILYGAVLADDDVVLKEYHLAYGNIVRSRGVELQRSAGWEKRAGHPHATARGNVDGGRGLIAGYAISRHHIGRERGVRALPPEFEGIRVSRFDLLRVECREQVTAGDRLVIAVIDVDELILARTHED